MTKFVSRRTALAATLPTLALALVVGSGSGAAYARLSSPNAATSASSNTTRVGGAFVDDVSCIPHPPLAPELPGTIIPLACTQHGNEVGSLTGSTIYEVSGTLDTSNGDLQGGGLETFTGTYLGDDPPTSGTLIYDAPFFIEGKTQWAHSDATIIGGTGDFAGSSGCMVFDGNGGGYGGYAGVWHRDKAFAYVNHMPPTNTCAGQIPPKPQTCHEADGDGDVASSEVAQALPALSLPNTSAQSGHAHVQFEADACKDGGQNSATFRDPAAGVDFKSTKVTDVRYYDSRHTVALIGRGTNAGRSVMFSIVAFEATAHAPASLSIALGNGYKNTGSLPSGSILLH